MEKNYLEINRSLWNAKTEHHVQSEFYDLHAFKNGKDSLIGPEAEFLENIEGKHILHLQCHFGQDSLSLARRGAKVTGLDLSDAAIVKAIELNTELGLDAKFVCSDVYSTREKITDTFDIVYTSYGTIGWLPDIDLWANVVSNSLKENGKLVFAEFHPVVWMFDSGFKHIEYSYFNRDAIIENAEGTYADRNAEIQEQEVSWNHALTEVISALLDHGLKISTFKEYDYSPYNCFNNMVQIAENRYQIKGSEGKLPMMYAIVAQKLV